MFRRNYFFKTPRGTCPGHTELKISTGFGRNDTGLGICRGHAKRGSRAKPNLFSLFFNPLEYGLKGTALKAALLAGFVVIFVSGTQSLRPKVEGISEWFVNAGQDVATGHKNLERILARAFLLDVE